MRGHLGFPIKPTPPPPYTPTAVVLTSGSSYTVPSGATYVKAWAVGAGGAGGASPGGAGGVAYKTWAASGGASLSYSVSDTAGSNATVTLSGTTITGYGGTAGSGSYPGTGGSYAGGDGGATGGDGWTGAYDDTDHYYGGSINGTAIDYTAVGSVNVMPTDVAGILDAVCLSGFSVYYGGCPPASYFGSGAARFWFYGGNISYYANRGGGGVDSVWTHGGGAIVLYFT